MPVKEHAVTKLSDKCEVCRADLEIAIDLPDLPLTGVYCRAEDNSSLTSYDQQLLFCPECGHGQLLNSISPKYLYGETYQFRTSESGTASQGVRYFADYIETLFPDTKFNRIVEFGSNDAYLLELLKDKAEKLLGVDPVWEAKENSRLSSNVSVVGGLVQNVDFSEVIGGTPDLVVSQHTMEHIEHPRDLVESLFQKGDSDTVYVFELPCFNPLLEQYRYDQVFHQHLHYFSLNSFLALLNEIGGELIDYTFNYTYWGALIIAFKKAARKDYADGNIARDYQDGLSLETIQNGYSIFRKQMEVTSYSLSHIDTEFLYGYGAALMLPILGYHLKNDFSQLQAVLDDDPKKDGMSYPNLNVKISKPEGIDISRLSILLTAMDNRRPIIRNLVEKRPRHIINPLNFI